MGPEGKSAMDLRMDALAAHRDASGVEPQGRESLVKSLIPLFVAQGLDMLTTEMLLAQGKPQDSPSTTWSSPIERNPLPGMGHTAGRVGWGAAEALLTAALMKRAPKLGTRARDALVVTHSGLARGNADLTDEQSRLVKMTKRK